MRAGGRFTFGWNAEDENVGAGRWRPVVRITCESGNDGSPVFQKRATEIRIRA